MCVCDVIPRGTEEAASPADPHRRRRRRRRFKSLQVVHSRLLGLAFSSISEATTRQQRGSNKIPKTPQQLAIDTHLIHNNRPNPRTTTPFPSPLAQHLSRTRPAQPAAFATTAVTVLGTPSTIAFDQPLTHTHTLSLVDPSTFRASPPVHISLGSQRRPGLHLSRPGLCTASTTTTTFVSRRSATARQIKSHSRFLSPHPFCYSYNRDLNATTTVTQRRHGRQQTARKRR